MTNKQNKTDEHTYAVITYNGDTGDIEETQIIRHFPKLEEAEGYLQTLLEEEGGSTDSFEADYGILEIAAVRTVHAKVSYKVTSIK